MKISTLLCFQAESTGGKSRRSGFVVKSWRRQSRQVPAFILDEEDDVLEDEKMTAGVAGAFVDTLAEEVVVEDIHRYASYNAEVESSSSNSNYSAENKK